MSDRFTKIARVAVGSMFSLGIILYCIANKKINNMIEDSKQVVKQHDIYKYVDILESPNADNYETWNKAAKEIQDSLRLDSIAKANYTKGLLMVKDSLQTIKQDSLQFAKDSLKIMK